MNIYYQEGGQEMGQEEQLMQLFQAFADIVQDDEFNTAEEVMQMFMELAPEEQQAFVQQAIQIIQQEQGEPELESNPEEELIEQQEVQPMMQQGGINPQKIQQILQAYASSIGEDPNVILQQFQQMQPEEQQQALQQIVQQLQEGGEEQMQMQEQQQMQDGGYVNNTGYLEGYETSNNPYNVIPSNKISMVGVRPDIQYIKGTDNLGNTQYMQHGKEYEFDGDFVVEEPVYAQNGKNTYDRSLSEKKLNEALTRIKNSKQSEYDKERKSEMIRANYRQLVEIDENVDQILKSKIANPGDQRGLINKISQGFGTVFNPYNYSKYSAEYKLNAWDKERKNFIDAIDYISTSPLSAEDLYSKSSTFKPSKNNTAKSILSGVVAPISKFAESTGNLILDDYDPANRGYVFDDISPVKEVKGKKKPATKNNKTTTPKIIIRGGSTGKPIEMTELSTEKGKYIGSDGNEWLSTDGGKNFKIVKKQTTSANQDKPKIKLPDKRTKAALAEEETPFVLQPPPVPTEIPEQQNTFDYRQPLIIDSRFDEYSIPEEDKTVELNPNVFNRSNVGVGKKFFNQTGGYNYAQDGFKPRKFKSELDFNSRLNPGSSMNMGAKSDGDFEYAYPDKKKIYYVNGAAQLDPINQYDTMPMGANSMNYEAPNAESMKMWNRGSDRILDLSNYADRFGVEHFGANTKPVSDQNVDRKSKFQQFMDKYGKKADMQFDPVPVQSAPLYNLLKASEPLAPQFRGQMDVRYAEKPMVDPRPFIQELQNQYALSSRNINSNSPTGMAWQSNLQAKMKAGVEDILNKTSAANQQTAAENELSRINAFNQEQQANNTYNQQYVQSMLQAQAAKDLAMGESLSSLDQLRANAVKARNNFKSLAVMTPGLKPVENFNTLLTGSQGFNIDKDFQQLVSTVTQAKTPEEVAAAQKIYSDALKKKQAAAKAATETKQIGGKINDFFRKRY